MGRCPVEESTVPAGSPLGECYAGSPLLCISLWKLSCRFYDLLRLWDSEQRAREEGRGTLCHNRKASAPPWTGPQPRGCCGLRDWAPALCGRLPVFLLGYKVMICIVHPSPLPGGASPGVRTVELCRALPFPLTEQKLRRQVPGPGGSTGGPGLVCAIPPTLLRGSDTGMALMLWKLLSKMLLSLHTGSPM